MKGWEIGLLLVAAYIGVMSLVRLMLARRTELLNRFRQEMQEERRRRKREETKQKQKAAASGTIPSDRAA